MNKESWIFIILITILFAILSAVAYLFLTTDLFLQMKQMLKDTLKSTESNQFDSGKVYPYFLLLAITGLIYGILVAIWHYWKAFQEKRSKCAECRRQRSPAFVHIRYVCHCDKNDKSVGYCYPLFQDGRALQHSPHNTHISVTFFQKKPPPPPLPNKDNLLGNA